MSSILILVTHRCASTEPDQLACCWVPATAAHDARHATTVLSSSMDRRSVQHVGHDTRGAAHAPSPAFRPLRARMRKYLERQRVLVASRSPDCMPASIQTYQRTGRGRRAFLQDPANPTSSAHVMMPSRRHASHHTSTASEEISTHSRSCEAHEPRITKHERLMAAQRRRRLKCRAADARSSTHQLHRG